MRITYVMRPIEIVYLICRIFLTLHFISFRLIIKLSILTGEHQTELKTIKGARFLMILTVNSATPYSNKLL